MTVDYWWTCTLTTDGRVCLDRMAQSTDPRRVERDRDAHLEHAHPGQAIDGAKLRLSSWPRA